MVPDEEPRVASEPSQPRPGQRPRRSRRGGRRHSRGRGPRSPSGPPSGFVPEEPPLAGEPENRSTPERELPADAPAITRAIDQVTRVIDELKHALDEMEEVLETLELAERQKIDDEREIDSLQRALRQLHRPGQGGGPRGRYSAPPSGNVPREEREERDERDEPPAG